MLLILIFLLLTIGASIVGSIYSNFLVFYYNFSESENYHKAYYNAIAALERAELVTKQRSPGYVGSGGWIIDKLGGTGSINGGGSDGILTGFSYLSNDNSTSNTSTIFWNVESLTSRIPAKGEGDVEAMLAYIDPSNPNNPENSNNYNMMDYEDAQIFLLYYDNGLSGGVNDNPYNKRSCKTGGCILSKPQAITGTIRLPKNLYPHGGFGKLNENNTLVGTGPNNDVIVDWQIRGKYNGDPFTIYSMQNIAGKTIFYNLDSAFREKDINNNLNFNFGGNNWSPISNNNTKKVIIISPKENDIKNLQNYQNLFNNAENPQLRFSLLNLLKDISNKLYPFLEYYVDFGTNVADKYFTINAEGNYVDYRVNLIIWKPTIKESVLGNFTTIF